MIIWHNPRCSKSRQTLKLIEESGHAVEQRLYLEQAPSPAELAATLKKLGLKAASILRKGEQEYKDMGEAVRDYSDSELVQLMCEHPKLIERPIVIKGDKAILGRPPENVNALL